MWHFPSKLTVTESAGLNVPCSAVPLLTMRNLSSTSNYVSVISLLWLSVIAKIQYHRNNKSQTAIVQRVHFPMFETFSFAKQRHTFCWESRSSQSIIVADRPTQMQCAVQVAPETYGGWGFTPLVHFSKFRQSQHNPVCELQMLSWANLLLCLSFHVHLTTHMQKIMISRHWLFLSFKHWCFRKQPWYCSSRENVKFNFFCRLVRFRVLCCVQRSGGKLRFLV